MTYFKILHVTDIHTRKSIDVELYSKIIKDEKVNLIVISGDITSFGKKKDVRKILTDFDVLGLPVFYIVGNCDPRDSTDIELTNVKPLEGKVEVYNEVQFVGLSGSNKTPFRTPFELSEEEIAGKLVHLKTLLDFNKTVILVSHVPPMDSEADIIRTSTHVGSPTVKEFIQQEKIDAILTGHIHESETVSTFYNALCVNPGSARDNQGAIIEVQIYDDGTPFLNAKLIELRK